MTVVLSPQAENDLDQIFDYIARDNPSAASRTTDRILQSIYMLAQFPEMAPSGHLSGTRELLIARLPYRVVYRTEGAAVRILTIVHTSRQWPPL